MGNIFNKDTGKFESPRVSTRDEDPAIAYIRSQLSGWETAIHKPTNWNSSLRRYDAMKAGPEKEEAKKLMLQLRSKMSKIHPPAGNTPL